LIEGSTVVERAQTVTSFRDITVMKPISEANQVYKNKTLGEIATVSGFTQLRQCWTLRW